MAVVALVFVASALVYYTFRAAVNFYSRKAKCKPGFANDGLSVYPHIDPFWGLDLSLAMWRDYTRGRLAEGMRLRHARCGATFKARELFGAECIYTVDPENIRDVTTIQFARFQKSAWVDEASKHIGHGVLMNEGAAWRRSRALLKPVFAKTTLDELALVEPHVKNMIAAARAQQGKTLDFLDLATRFSLDVVTEFLFDGSVKSLSGAGDKADGSDFLAMVKAFEPACGLFIAVGGLAWFKLAFSYRKLLAVVGGMKAFFKRRLDLLRKKQRYAHRDDVGSRKSSTSLFRMLEQEGLSVDDMQAELQNIFFASFDTTTSLLANLVHVIAGRPDVQQKLRDEIAPLRGTPPTKQDISAMSYLRCVLYEGLRLYTPVASHSRQAAVDTTLPRGGGPDGRSSVAVRAGTSVVWSVYALNRDPMHYGEDWAAFRPERWADGTHSASSAPYFMPFGSGPRACIGQQMAQTEIAYVLVRLLQAFETLESRDERPFREAEAVSFYSGNGTWVEMS
ncbi:cytochrome P450 [Cordyceps fumosorosea ARSEF 2679]|uniref:Cytochrome P450 n=1 Tax=Cordyceps fumosorosea (strain ARSEF 2679) TaxID=1081104 RepID=A0A168ESY6_CORFA|nr:cytochrome P450 [Cordyceps fumosorosea ARSEF 2679]OAA74176.1 cytochrome P450 [Cordyceps fumosorosea ARSEF 2679]